MYLLIRDRKFLVSVNTQKNRISCKALTLSLALALFLYIYIYIHTQMQTHSCSEVHLVVVTPWKLTCRFSGDRFGFCVFCWSQPLKNGLSDPGSILPPFKWGCRHYILWEKELVSILSSVNVQRGWLFVECPILHKVKVIGGADVMRAPSGEPPGELGGGGKVFSIKLLNF